MIRSAGLSRRIWGGEAVRPAPSRHTLTSAKELGSPHSRPLALPLPPQVSVESGWLRHMLMSTRQGQAPPAHTPPCGAREAAVGVAVSAGRVASFPGHKPDAPRLWREHSCERDAHIEPKQTHSVADGRRCGSRRRVQSCQTGWRDRQAVFQLRLRSPLPAGSVTAPQGR